MSRCLVLLEYLLQHGNHEMVLSQVQNNLHHVQAVTSFTLKNANGIDVGHDVREKAHRFLCSPNPTPNLPPTPSPTPNPKTHPNPNPSPNLNPNPKRRHATKHPR